MVLTNLVRTHQIYRRVALLVHMAVTLIITVQGGKVAKGRQQGSEDYTEIPNFGFYKMGREACWETARRRCEREGAHLWIINSGEEFKAVTKIHKIEKWVWIGIDDYTTKGEYVTPHGTTIKETGYWKLLPKAKWNGNRVGMVNRNGFIAADKMFKKRKFICEKHSPDEFYLEKRSPWLPMGYRIIVSPITKLPIGYYKFHKDEANWETARRRCEAEGAHLMVPDRPEEMQVVNELENKQWHWIGFHTYDGEPKTLLGHNLQKPIMPGKTDASRCGMVKIPFNYSVGGPLEKKKYICELYEPRDTVKEIKPSAAPKDYDLDFGKNSYKLHNTPEYWETARLRCESERGYLAVISSKEEAKAVLLNANSSDRYILLGFDDFMLQRDFVYLDGTRVEDTFIKWEKNSKNPHPNNKIGCGTAEGLLGACSPIIKRPFLCEWSDIRELHTRIRIPYSYRQFGPLGWYKVYRSPVPWMRARRICEAEGAHLMVVNSQEEVDKVLKTSGISSRFWLGFDNFDETKNFRTLFGETLETAGYAVWANGKPDMNKDKHCGAGNAKGFLMNNNCDSSIPFICERYK